MGLLWKKAALVCSIPSVLSAAGISYSVDFKGLDDAKALRLIRSSSQLLALRKKPPASINALRFRAESDIPELTRALRACGYFEAEIDIEIKKEFRDYRVIIAVSPGPQYLINQYKIEFETEDPVRPKPVLPLSDLDIDIGDAADTKKILDSELCALHILAERGYPLATIRDRQIIADGKTKRVQVVTVIETGPLSHFGATQIEGNCSVKDILVKQQIKWYTGDLYENCLVEETQAQLMDTGLFSSVYITHPKNLDAQGYLPMKIEVAETKHKSVSLGASYQTNYGPGASFGWENRNVGGVGRRVTLQADIAQRVHSGIATYQIPNLFEVGQSLVVQAQASYESITPYRMRSYTFLNRFDRTVNPYFYFSIGPKAEYLMVRNSADDGDFLLAEGSIYLRWTNVEDFLNPRRGLRLDYRGTPAVNIKDISELYYSQLLTLSSYHPFFDELLILAQKITLGTTLSKALKTVPIPKRFFGGSEDHLRGYEYYCPLDSEGKPTGGRSAIFYSIESRILLTQSLGVVPFFDVGNVYLEQCPTFKGKWKKSAGIGLRYYSFVGPLRLDVAFPLNRRKEIDKPYWISVSLGQAF